MKIRLQKRYSSDKFTFDVLKKECGIYAVRGPRGVIFATGTLISNSMTEMYTMQR